MDYQTALESFLEQFSTSFPIENSEKLKPFKKVVIVGMGGSRLAPDLLHMLHPEMEIKIHSDYGLPAWTEDKIRESLVIANSHSGDTAETLSAAQEALDKGYNLAIVTMGGQLGKFAQDNKIPYVITKEAEGMPARLTFGFSFAALSVLLGLSLEKISDTEAVLARSKELGNKMVGMFDGKIPLIFAPQDWMPLAYIWKISMNETAKVPAYCNRLPEMDHNEIAGYNSENGLCGGFSALIIRDRSDERMAARINATADLLRQSGISAEVVDLPDGSGLARAAELSLAAHWAAYKLAEHRGVDPAAVPVIEQLKEELKTAAR